MAVPAKGYPFIFQMNEKSDTDDLLIETHQYRFKSTKSNHTYIVRVEKYPKHCYCLKFYDKANTNSRNKFSLRTDTFEPRNIFHTLFYIAMDILNKKGGFLLLSVQSIPKSPTVSSCEPLVLPVSSSSLVTAFSASERSFTSLGSLLNTEDTVLMALTLSFSSSKLS